MKHRGADPSLFPVGHKHNIKSITRRRDKGLNDWAGLYPPPPADTPAPGLQLALGTSQWGGWGWGGGVPPASVVARQSLKEEDEGQRSEGLRAEMSYDPTSFIVSPQTLKQRQEVISPQVLHTNPRWNFKENSAF